MTQPDPIIIAFAGHAGSGKDTAAAHLISRYGFVQAAFADPIRSMALLIMEEAGIDHAWLTERARKEQRMPGLGVSARALMQTLGTEVGRHLQPDLWVRHMALRLGLPGAGLPEAQRCPVHDRIVISDARFANEAHWVHLVGGWVIRLHREQAAAVRSHASEAEILSLDADVDLHNHGPSLEGLHALLDVTMATWGVEPREDGPLFAHTADPAGPWCGVDHQSAVD